MKKPSKNLKKLTRIIIISKIAEDKEKFITHKINKAGELSVVAKSPLPLISIEELNEATKRFIQVLVYVLGFFHDIRLETDEKEKDIFAFFKEINAAKEDTKAR